MLNAWFQYHIVKQTTASALEYDMRFRFRLHTLALVKMLLVCIPLSSEAISISAFRIYLDSDKPTTSFTIHNPDIDHQGCELKLAHYNFDENS
jgi:hypothetical protein